MATGLEKIQKLQEQIEEAKTAALEELREKRREAMAQVKDLDKQIAELGGRQSSKSTTTRQKSDEPCKICGFKTEPPHDARRHRGQGDKKKPFTKEELEALDMKKTASS